MNAHRLLFDTRPPKHPLPPEGFKELRHNPDTGGLTYEGSDGTEQDIRGASQLANDADSPVKGAIDAITAASLGVGTADNVTHATVTATISLNTGSAGLIDGEVNITNSAGNVTQLGNNGVTSNRQVNWADASGVAVVVPAYADNTAADADLDSGDFYWNTTSNKLDQVA